MHVCGLLQDKLHIQNLHNVQTQGDSKFPLSQMCYQELQNAVFKCFHSLREKKQTKTTRLLF